MRMSVSAITPSMMMEKTQRRVTLVVHKWLLLSERQQKWRLVSTEHCARGRGSEVDGFVGSINLTGRKLQEKRTAANIDFLILPSKFYHCKSKFYGCSLASVCYLYIICAFLKNPSFLYV